MLKPNLLLTYNKIDLKLKVKFSNNVNPQDFCNNYYTPLEFFKNKIDNIPNKLWDNQKKITNIYELINTKNKNINYKPISRAYFKLIEMINDFNILDINKNLFIVGLAEGPGGFIEAMINYRKRRTEFKNYKDQYLCMSLYASDNTIPKWNSFLFKNSEINIYYGNDGTGDLYNIENILSLSEKCNHNVDIVTCDGGFNFSENYDQQEQQSYRLILCQIISGINILKSEGTLIVKIFDIFTIFTVKIIYFLTGIFETVNITKPYTSRSANSEKYIICKNFKTVSKNCLDSLNICVQDMNILVNQNKYVTDIFDFSVPQDFCNLVEEYNQIIISNQLKNIINTLILIEINNKNITYKKEQIEASEKWCKKYNFK